MAEADHTATRVQSDFNLFSKGYGYFDDSDDIAATTYRHRLNSMFRKFQAIGAISNLLMANEMNHDGEGNMPLGDEQHGLICALIELSSEGLVATEDIAISLGRESKRG